MTKLLKTHHFGIICISVNKIELSSGYGVSASMVQLPEQD
jgi:hypothetical protein